MATGYDALSEKERETLRLLLCGHDAKSIARHLGLSVHTIHERLREARRKMGTASSREAARLLHELEGAPSSNLVKCMDKSLRNKGIGDAADNAGAYPVDQPDQAAATPRRLGWIIGGSAMTISLALLALTAFSGIDQAPATTSLSASPAVVPTAASEQAAVRSAEAFLALFDRDDWAASWQATHKAFQLLNTVEWWAQASQGVRGRVGKAITRKLDKVDFTPAPPNGYWTATFKARYAKAGDVIETLQMASEDGGWKVTAITVE